MALEKKINGDLLPAGLTVAEPKQKSVFEILRQARFNRQEVAGSLGDLGTFLPLLVAMSAQNGLSFGSALFFAGLFNLGTGITFAIPMAVQPMKAIAAIALTERLSAAQIVAAGMSVSAAVLFLGATGLINWVSDVVPKSVIRGLQLALGLSLLMKGIQMVHSTGKWLAPDSYLTAAFAALVVLAVFSRKIPAALVLFGTGILIAVWSHPNTLPVIRPTLPHLSPPTWHDFVSAFPKAALPQIPLTILNSVIAVCVLSRDLFPGRPATPKRVSLSVGVMNLVGGMFGAMPMCHGAGGLAGQYKFGARTNGSILFLGVAKMVLAVFFGGSLMLLCGVFPSSILGTMLAASGIELGLVARDQIARRDAFVMLLTAGACIGLNSFSIGFLIGLGATVLLTFSAEESGEAI